MLHGHRTAGLLRGLLGWLLIERLLGRLRWKSHLLLSLLSWRCIRLRRLGVRRTGLRLIWIVHLGRSSYWLSWVCIVRLRLLLLLLLLLLPLSGLLSAVAILLISVRSSSWLGRSCVRLSPWPLRSGCGPLRIESRMRSWLMVLVLMRCPVGM